MSETHDYHNEPEDSLLQKAKDKARQQLQNISETGDEERLSPAERLQAAKEQLFGLGQNLAEGIRHNKWQILIGEDVSGRVPALFVYELVKRYNVANNVEPPKLFFLSSGKKVIVDGERVEQENYEDLFAYVRQHGDVAKGKRALYITDTVHSGGSLQKSAVALGGNGIRFDVASLSSYVGPNVIDQPGLRNLTFYTGRQESQDQIGNIYTGFGGKPALRQATGVEKNGNEPITRATYQNSASVAELRTQIKDLAEEAYVELFRKPQQA